MILAILPVHVSTQPIDASHESTFSVSFQSDGTKSINEWMKYKDKIFGINKELTVCHWEKLRYFSVDFESIWSYCYIKNASNQVPECIQFGHYRNFDSIGRNIDVFVNKFVAKSVPFRHRTWNHFCYTYSAIHKTYKLYYNGKLIKEGPDEYNEAIASGKSVFSSSFTIAQEVDTIDGGYDPEQLFDGEISELNVWNEELDEMKIKMMAECLQVLKGNVVPWVLAKFVINEAKVINVTSVRSFCKKEKHLVLFPQKVLREQAKDLCEIHGGDLIAPSSKH